MSQNKNFGNICLTKDSTEDLNLLFIDEDRDKDLERRFESYLNEYSQVFNDSQTKKDESVNNDSSENN